MRASVNFLNPWPDFQQIQNEMNQLFGRRNPSAAVHPAVNVFGDESTLVLTAELPGLDPEQLDITVNRNSVVLKGTRPNLELKEGETSYRSERHHGDFERTIELPVDVDPNSADANYDKGVLTLKIARPAEDVPRKVSVKTV